MRRLIGAVAMVMAGCLNPVSDVPDSGPEHRFLSRPEPEDISPRFLNFWSSPAAAVYGLPPTRIRELASGEILLGPFECAFLADGGFVPATAAWRADARLTMNDIFPEWFVFDGGVYKAIPIESSRRLTVLGRYDAHAQQLLKIRQYEPPVDAGILWQPILSVRAFENADGVWFASTVFGTGRSCHTERRIDFEFTPIEPTEECFFPRGAMTIDDTTLAFGSTGSSKTEIRLIRALTETSREFIDGLCSSALEQQPGRLDFSCAERGRNVVTIHRANVNSTAQISSFTTPDGHVFQALVQAEPFLALTSTQVDGGFTMHACNQTQCKPLAEFSRWPPMVGATAETLSVAHYEPDAGVFMWRHQRSTLGL